MKLLNGLSRLKIIRDTKLLELYPPFFFMGVRVREVSSDFRHMEVSMPFRWYGSNMHGTMFGGFVCAVSDPLAALMCMKIFPGVRVWTKSHFVDFLKPVRKGLKIVIDITDEQIQHIRKELDAKGESVYVFEYPIRDQAGAVVAQVKNGVFMRYKKERTE